jgi:sRNA-binding carbon storage regulator CsrA
MKETLVIKDHLHKLVVETDDVEVLLQVEAFFETLVSQRDWWEDLTETQKTQIKASQSQLAQGEGIPHESVKEKVKALFARYE